MNELVPLTRVVGLDKRGRNFGCAVSWTGRPSMASRRPPPRGAVTVGILRLFEASLPAMPPPLLAFGFPDDAASDPHSLRRHGSARRGVDGSIGRRCGGGPLRGGDGELGGLRLLAKEGVDGGAEEGGVPPPAVGLLRQGAPVQAAAVLPEQVRRRWLRREQLRTLQGTLPFRVELLLGHLRQHQRKPIPLRGLLRPMPPRRCLPLWTLRIRAAPA